MKKASFFRIQFFTRMSVIATLGTLGLVILTGEPADEAEFLVTFAAQVCVWAVTWIAAWLLYRHWNMGKVINRMKSLNR